MKPQIAMYETDTTYVLHGSIPGVQLETVDVKDTALLLGGKQGPARFAQTIELPSPVQSEGLLFVQDGDEVRIVLPRREAAQAA